MNTLDLVVLLFLIFTGFGFLAFAFFYTVPGFGPPVAVFFIVVGVLLSGAAINQYEDSHMVRKTVSSVISELPKKTDYYTKTSYHSRQLFLLSFGRAR